jgi:hypothetical protein
MPPGKTFFSGTASSPFVLWEDILKKKPLRDRLTKNTNPVVYAANHHLTKRYTIIIRHFFKRGQKSVQASRNVQLEELIKKTGFTRFSH